MSPQRSAGRRRTVRILGTHGVPANYGGFETAAENVALFLADRGWRVIVYCQVDGTGPITRDRWKTVERVLIPIDVEGWKGTAKFDLISIRHASRTRDICLTFGYNTGIFNSIQRLRGIPNVINMDGIEWSRARWGFFRQAILYVNERFSALFGNALIADHPEIEKYLLTRAPARKLTTITYGAHPVSPQPIAPVEALGLTAGRYLTLICRPIPENSILELVQGFSRRHRGFDLVVLGKYEEAKDEYHRAVLEAASPEVKFVGAIYDTDVLRALRYYGRMYLHGHTVGGTNPSLVEAMAAANPVLAHDNPYNRWVVGEGARYFQTADDVSRHLDALLVDPATLDAMSSASLQRYEAEFTWDHVAGQYESLLLQHLPAHA
jgi:glycosyltransferase involved in cell wall biosynthesis